MHTDELAVDEALVRRLVDRDLPAWREEPIRQWAAAGSSNRLFRLGERYLVRMPRQPGGGATIVQEARWLPSLAGLLPVAVPGLVHVGDPGFGYGEQWSVVRWIPGSTPASGGSESAALAGDLAGLIRALHTMPPTADPPPSWYRAEPLRPLAEQVRRALAQCRALPGLDLDLDAAGRLWEESLTLPPPAPERLWLHGDLFAENLLVRDGRLAAVLDFGGLAVGVPDVDLVVAWDVLDGAGRRVFREELQVGEAAWLRGRAWALAIAAITLPYYWTTMPRRCASRLVMARAVLADASG